LGKWCESPLDLLAGHIGIGIGPAKAIMELDQRISMDGEANCF